MKFVMEVTLIRTKLPKNIYIYEFSTESSIFKFGFFLFLLGLIGTVGQAQPQHNETSSNERDIGVSGSELRLLLVNSQIPTLPLSLDLNKRNKTRNGKHKRRRRSVVHLYDMVICSTGCNPLAYKGYGCYCGFLGSGLSVDGIDRCCAKHDWCYNHAKCPPFLTYFVPYYWTCANDRPQCFIDERGWKGICGTDLCECDRQFAECLRKYPCPRSRAMCHTSPWRYTPEPDTLYYYP